MDWKTCTNEREKYQLYLASREWGLKREAVRARSGGLCERCKINPLSAVHHLTYARKYNERLEDLQAICQECHDFTHGRSDFDPAAKKKLAGKHGSRVVHLVLYGPPKNEGPGYALFAFELVNLPWRPILPTARTLACDPDSFVRKVIEAVEGRPMREDEEYSLFNIIGRQVGLEVNDEGRITDVFACSGVSEAKAPILLWEAGSGQFAREPEEPIAPEIIETPQLTPERTELEVLADQVKSCTRCPQLVRTRTQPVFGIGPIGAELCFVGEAPGADEDAWGEPFVGAAGQLLNRIIAACNMKRSEVYLCNIVACRPPGNRTPQPDEIGKCWEYLDKQIELVKPRFICALGSTAASGLALWNTSFKNLRGRIHDYKGIPVVCTYHPAYLLPHRNPDAKKEVWEDMKMLMHLMDRSAPNFDTWP